MLDEVAKEGGEIIVARAHKPLAVLISLKEYEEKILKKNREKILRNLSAQMERWKREHIKYTKNIDITKILREIRER